MWGADLTVAGIHSTNVFINQLRFIAGCFDARWLGEQRWHSIGSSDFGT
jgi:hypothetical protein